MNELDNTDKFIFIVGNSRSGTTMMSRIMGVNSAVQAFQEIHFFEWLVNPSSIHDEFSQEEAIALLNKMFGQQLQNFYQQENLEQYATKSMDVLNQVTAPLTPFKVYEAFLSYYSAENNKMVPCEQTPKNVFYLDKIFNSEKKSYVINMVRDPRAVLLSQKNKWKRRFYGEQGITLGETIRAWSLYHPLVTTRIWKSSIDSALKHKDNENLITVKYEELLMFPEKTVKKLCYKIGLEYQPEMLQIPNIGSSMGLDNEGKKGVDPSRINSWDNGALSNSEIYLCEKLLTNEMKMFGYDKSNRTTSFLSLFFEYLIFFPKLTIAFFLNLSRMKGIVSVLKVRLKGS